MNSAYEGRRVLCARALTNAALIKTLRMLCALSPVGLSDPRRRLGGQTRSQISRTIRRLRVRGLIEESGRAYK